MVVMVTPYHIILYKSNLAALYIFLTYTYYSIHIPNLSKLAVNPSFTLTVTYGVT